jgi:diguanylate cyclase (GGDEF)-like protein
VKPCGGGRVLLVDDSAVVRGMVAQVLAGSFAVEAASGGREAVELLERGDYDAVVADLHMPDVDGFAVLEAARRRWLGPEVVILTGAGEIDFAVRALRLGAHDFLVKPPQSPDEIVMAVARAVEKRQLRVANARLLRELEQLSRTDSLTGLLNRRAFDEGLAREASRARRHGYSLGFVLLDLDHFKRVNDTHGHAGGDSVLRACAGVLGRTLREGDAAYRYGGEEFGVLLPYASKRGALEAARRLVAAVAAEPVELPSGRLTITASAGAASLTGAQAQGAELVRLADAALYAAKRAGRNRALAAPAPRSTRDTAHPHPALAASG